MEKIKITFLGTGSAIPTPRRNHPAVLLQYKNENLLFDCGEGTQTQFRKAKLNPCKITRIFITHWHADHVLGIPGLLQTLMLNGYKKTLHIYGPSGTEKMARLYIGLFAHKGQNYPIKVHEISSSGKVSHKAKTKNGWGGGHLVVDEKEFTIQATAMKHDTPSLAYSFTIKSKTRINKAKLAKFKLPRGKLIGELAKGKKIKYKGKVIDGKKLIYGEPARKITYIMDTRPNEQSINLAKDSNLLICESTYSEKEKQLAADHSHLTAKQAAQIAKKSKSKKLILTHLSQRHETKPGQKKILQEAKKIFKNTTIASDLDSLTL